MGVQVVLATVAVGRRGRVCTCMWGVALLMLGTICLSVSLLDCLSVFMSTRLLA